MQQWDDAMRLALAEAKKSGQDVPVGAMLLDGYGEVVSIAHNEREILKDPTAHAEILAIKRASCINSSGDLSEILITPIALKIDQQILTDLQWLQVVHQEKVRRHRRGQITPFA